MSRRTTGRPPRRPGAPLRSRDRLERDEFEFEPLDAPRAAERAVQPKNDEQAMMLMPNLVAYTGHPAQPVR